MIASMIHFPIGLLADYLLTLLDVTDLVCLDSALMNHSIRKVIVDQWKGAKIHTKINIDEDSAKWLLERNLCIAFLNVSGWVADLSSLKELARSSNIQQISFVNAINDFIPCCGKVKGIISFAKCCRGMMEGCVLETIATSCAEL